jgi:MFS transporter, CP family, cyanate transporter
MSATTSTVKSTAPSGSATTAASAGFWRGRIGVIVGIVLLGVGLRYAVTGLSPLLPEIRAELGMDVAAASFLGMLPTLSFGIAGFVAPLVIRRLGAEATAVIALALAAAGSIARAFTDGVLVFLVLSAVALFGMGFGNVVGAPLVKKYWPDRPATMLTVFALLMQAGATLPAMTAIPVADAAGWRVSIASWAIISVLAILPWLAMLLKSRRSRLASAAEGSAPAAPTASGPKLGLAQLITSPIAIGTALFYAMASFNTYGMLAWLPTMLRDQGMSAGDAGLAFALFTFLTLPMAIVSPIVATKMRNALPYAVLLSLVFPAGYVGLLVAPELGVAWSVVMGIGGGAFPFAIAMFNARTRTPAGSAALAGFAMGTGYLFGTLGPLLGGALFAATGDWTAMLIVFAFTGVLLLIGARLMTRPGRFLEDKFEPAAAAAPVSQHQED